MPSIPTISISDKISLAAVSGVGLVLVVVLLVLFSKPIGKALKVLLHGAFGFVLLFALNFFVNIEAFHLDITFPNCVTAGFGGIPGVILLLAYKNFFE